jgi:hypothetical protein
MFVNVDVEKMLKLKLTGDEYIFLDLVYNRKFPLAKKVARNNGFFSDESLRSMIERRLVHNVNPPGELDVSKIIVRKWASDELEETHNYFAEFLEHYPISVIRPDGSKDMLRRELPNSKLIYNKLVKGKPELHQDIIRCLDAEVSERTQSGQLKYMKRLPKWLAAEDWKLYLPALNEKTNNKTDKPGYGLDLE